MSFIKKNLLFCIVVVLCLAAFLAGIVVTFTQYSELKDTRQNLAGTETQLISLLQSSPAPTEENLAAAEQNLAELKATLADIRKELDSGTDIDPSGDGVSVIAGIQQYISKFQREAAENKNETGDPAPIKTPDNFAFGFEQFIDEATVPESPEKAARLDKQRLILRYLLTELMAADPHSIDAVKREVLERTAVKGNRAQGRGQGAQQGFSISPAVSARVPGAIDTLAFSLTFSGYTDSLREFLNRLARFEYPIVVRSIQVTRPSGDKTVVETPRNNDPSGFFGLFGEESASEQADAVAAESSGPAQKPVIEENLSKFTVVLEFIEVVLPEAPTSEVSDPA